MRKLALVLGLVATGSLAFGSVLFDNGPLSTGNMSSNGVAAPAGTTWSECQSVGGLTNSTAGWNVSQALGYRVADDFTIPAGQSWTISDLYIPSYQTNAPTSPSPYTAGTLRIWQGSAPGGTLVFGDTTTNRLAAGSAFASIYRIFNATPNTSRAVFGLTLNVGTTLGPGTYWADWSFTGNAAYSGPWAPPVTLVGQLQKPGSNSQQYNGTSWAAIIDTGSNTTQDLAFVVNGVPEPASLALLALGLLLRRR